MYSPIFSHIIVLIARNSIYRHFSSAKVASISQPRKWFLMWDKSLFISLRWFSIRWTLLAKGLSPLLAKWRAMRCTSQKTNAPETRVAKDMYTPIIWSNIRIFLV